MNTEIVQDIANRISKNCLINPGTATKDAEHIKALIEREQVSSRVGVDSIVDVFIGLRHAKGFEGLDLDNQRLLQIYTLRTIEFLTGNEDRLTTPYVDTLQRWQDILEVEAQISPSLVRASELIATRVAIGMRYITPNPNS